VIVFHVGQLLLAAVVVAIVVDRVRVLLYQAPLDTAPWLRAVTSAAQEGEVGETRALVAAAGRAWAAQVARVAVDRPEDLPLEEIVSDLRYDALKRLGALQSLARVSTAVGFLGAILELIWLLSGDHGLLGLMAGLPEKVAAEGAMLSVTLGVATSIFAFSALSVLKRGALALMRDMGRTAAELEALWPRGADGLADGAEGPVVRSPAV